MNRSSTLKLAVLLLSIVLAAASVIHANETGGQQPISQAPASGQAKPADAARPETLQLLKGMQQPQIMQKMREISAALGVDCSYCHMVPQFRQDTPAKSIARLMLRDYEMGMKHKDGTAVGCADCHKGRPTPLRTLAFEGAVGKKLTGLQVLKGMPEERVTQVMVAFTKALGVECDYCHTDDFDAETPRKQIARYMMTEFSSKLVKQDGSAVNCNSCHQGHARPLAILPFPPPPQQRQQPAEKKPN
ncbi:MAG: photosynthetic reaction center cytochrome c subunit family protein [Acidobacteriota bacterium]